MNIHTAHVGAVFRNLLASGAMSTLCHPQVRRVALAVMLALSAGAGHAADSKASQLYEDALQRFDQKDLPGAIIQLKNAIKADRKLLPVHVLLGKVLLANGDVGPAEVAFTEALSLGVNRAEVVVPMARAVIAQAKQQQLVDQPRFAIAGLPPTVQSQLLLLRASSLSDLGDAKGGLKAIEEAKALDPTSPEPWLAEIPVRIRARQMREAVAASDKALALAPATAEGLYLRGTIAHAQGDLVSALAHYDQTLKLDPGHAESLVARAGLAADQRRAAEARQDVNELLKAAPRDPRGAYLKALLDEREGNATGARKALNDVTGLLDPIPMDYFRYRPQALLLGGLAHYGLNEKEKAKPYLEMLQRLQNNNPVSKLLAQIYLAEKNVDRAIESLDLYLKSNPNDSQAVLLLASAHLSQGRHVRATQLMQTALRGQDLPSYHAVLGISLVGAGKLSDGAKELEAAFAKDPTQIQAGVALTTLYMKSRQAARAVVVAKALTKQQPSSAGLQNLLGNALLENGEAGNAKQAFELASKLDPSFMSPQVNLARLDSDARAFDAAGARLATVLKTDDKNVEALLEQGTLQERRGRMAEAQRSFEKAADHSGPTDLQPALTLVDFLLRTSQPEAAREATKRLTSKAPDAVPVLLALARTSLASGDPATARTTLTRATTLANYDAPVQLQIAMMQMSAGSLPGATHSLEKALSERPNFLPAEALMGELELRQGDATKAEARARAIVSKYPKSGAGHALLGDVAMSRQQTAAALAAYRQAHLLEQSTDSLLRVYRGLAKTDPSGATQLAEQWLRARPRDTVVRRVLADGYARAGNLAAARASYESVIRTQPDDAETLNNLAQVLLMSNDPGAQKMAELALQKQPGAPHIIGTAGWAAHKAGQDDRALQLLRDARLRDPNNPDTRYYLGAVLAHVGRNSEAKEELQGALRTSKEFSTAKDAEKLLASLMLVSPK
jgi:cellulose synthase operon protein C